jgi:signal transduction histidine kinase
MWTWLLIGIALGVLLTVPVAWLWTRRTERRVRLAETQARANERLAEMGTMTGGLAHEIKNPLSTIGLNVQLLGEDLEQLKRNAPPDTLDEEHLGRVRRRFETVSREANRLRDILEDFLRFAGRVELDRSPRDINRLVDELVDFFEPQAAAAKVKLRTVLGASPAEASVDGPMLKQALLNLLLNATQAMSDAREKQQDNGGADELILRTTNTRDLGRPAVRLHVTDTGPGMDEATVAKVFQPYFTTKRGGSGLGLPTSRRIIEEHGGTLTVHSVPGKGTDFILTLPTAPTNEGDA